MMTQLAQHLYSSVPVLRAPKSWKQSCVNVEYSLHQLAPYIGKIKSRIAGDLIERFSAPGDLVVDPFAGAGTIPLEAVIRGRRAFAADISPYARILSQAKLSPPETLESALNQAMLALSEAESLPEPDIRLLPRWVGRFFHPKTLSEIVRFASVARRFGNEFLMACFLGILHHQRPGFLSYPSSHLIPYLRDKKYPRNKFPEMYAYRELKPRLFSKIERVYRRFPRFGRGAAVFYESPVERLDFPKQFDALITSPPYMNALDYGRDNRLRLWFIDPNLAQPAENSISQRRKEFVDAIMSVSTRLHNGLRRRGRCVFVVGEEVQRTFSAHPAEIVVSVVEQQSRSIRLRQVMTDSIPDIRRTRRDCRGVKTEQFLVFERT